jgi:hypothetical protein
MTIVHQASTVCCKRCHDRSLDARRSAAPSAADRWAGRSGARFHYAHLAGRLQYLDEERADPLYEPPPDSGDRVAAGMLVAGNDDKRLSICLCRLSWSLWRFGHRSSGWGGLLGLASLAMRPLPGERRSVG